jgi:hypothetical protein
MATKKKTTKRKGAKKKRKAPKKSTKKKVVKSTSKKTKKKPAKKAAIQHRSDEQLKEAEAYLGDASKTLPLSQSFFVTSILGFIISATLMIYGTIDPTWGFTFCLVFVMMFIASFVTIHPKERYHS